MRVRKIEATADLQEKRVAAYARVSTLTEQQEESYETQVNYYSEYIRHVAGWTFAGIYSDQGITGTSARKRPGFLKMLDAARAHEFDILLVKSISRFSRNVSDAVKYIHELRGLGIEIRFEKEGITTFDPSSEIMLNLMAVVAQEESRSLSTNVSWGNRKRAEMGIRRLGSHHILGFDEVNGILTPNDDAWIVKEIFTRFAAGDAPADIINGLAEKGARTLHSKGKFKFSNLMSILNNEAYMGDRLIQKAPPKNYLTKKPDLTVAYDSYYLRDNHSGIVSRELWDAAQYRLEMEKAQRDKGIRVQKNTHFLYGKVVCGTCGRNYIRINSRGAGNMTCKAWECPARMRDLGEERCKNVIIREDTLLEKLSEILGFEWKGAEEFDVWAFREMVDKVVITGEKIEVVWAEAA